ncbi:hypothetical protein KIH39_14715 [Telmatocola sphagniphila]|uniref:Uncharacterized protein n=1 Tax=Telmatocola sphagniphila TaxID=1123043 RepID=A0A8E6B2X2_9BACT|nr:hypothetical protein [Telmatocola sphagniphila]QVL30111.1 hypothetical protein KIH39_14715 [Telmatocola sphagniphila]
MRFRPVVLLSLWTLLIGPVLAMPTPWSGSKTQALQPITTLEKPIHIPHISELRK